MIAVKRIYEQRSPADGKRFLVDRIWPRGMGREAAGITAWLKDLAPSTELRRWFGHDPARWEEFRERYLAELAEKEELLESLRRETAHAPVTLVYAARDTERNNAVVLKELLEG